MIFPLTVKRNSKTCPQIMGNTGYSEKYLYFNNFKTKWGIYKNKEMWKTMPGRVKQVPQDSTDRTDTGHSTDKHLQV